MAFRIHESIVRGEIDNRVKGTVKGKIWANGMARGDDYHDNAFTVALLNRALGHLRQAQAALETAATRKLLPNSLITDIRGAMFVVREEIIQLMEKLRRHR